MDQKAACALAREAGRRATELGVALECVEDPQCADLIASCRRSKVDVTEVLAR